MPNSDDEGAPDLKEINKISIKLPVFWSNSPSTWFVQAEAQFALAQITSDLTRYNYIISSLPQDIAESVTDILENPPTKNLYNNLKNNLISRRGHQYNGSCF